VPLYDYDCANCGRRFEVIHGVHADPPASCPLCGGGPVKKAIQAPAVHFKGSGWAKKERRATAAPGKTASGDADGAGDAAPAAASATTESATSGSDATSTTSTTGSTTDQATPKTKAAGPAGD
jgi:putative FmdB family regulatory protein